MLLSCNVEYFGLPLTAEIWLLPAYTEVIKLMILV